MEDELKGILENGKESELRSQGAGRRKGHNPVLYAAAQGASQHTASRSTELSCPHLVAWSTKRIICYVEAKNSVPYMGTWG